MELTGSVALRLDDEITFLAAAAGGEVFAGVVHETGSSGAFVKKRLGSPGVEDLSLEVGLAMSDALFDWIAASWQAQAVLKDGGILAFDHALVVRTAHEFVNARLVATTIPTLDAASRSPGHLSLLLRPEAVGVKAGAGKLPAAMMRQKLWRASDFRLDIDGLDGSTVSRIAAFTVPGPVDGRVDFPGLEVSLSAAAAATWRAWFEDFVLAGHNDDACERHGTITFLLPDHTTALATIELEGLGIFRLETEAGGAPSQIARVTAGLYCERMSLHHGGGIA